MKKQNLSGARIASTALWIRQAIRSIGVLHTVNIMMNLGSAKTENAHNLKEAIPLMEGGKVCGRLTCISENAKYAENSAENRENRLIHTKGH